MPKQGGADNQNQRNGALLQARKEKRIPISADGTVDDTLCPEGKDHPE
jgi:hypothetical protein